ncbi:polysaccharide biosynthesis protein [Paenibacillus tyrfis]|uniref:polysaccharide biosynthesis protein n=1 Tax=Paenibacillus tyrfis TaxID=1501230 RepID=UPI00209EABF1|nr:polysaccharide biosynthesis protein [Paenibacillus tyrfis]MCP1306866.1 polysaccharide biosynthesis protein [Paenibacillus tyrfis]
MIATREMLYSFFSNQSILVTGGTGSIGRGIVEALLSYRPKRIVVFSKDDSKQYMMKLSYENDPIVSFCLGDIRDYESVENATVGMDMVFHTAALKQVSVCENFPYETVKTNIIGSENVIRAAIRNGVKKVVNISTDKVVNTYNALGASKLIAEKLFASANAHPANRQTRLCTIRFGNVIGSRGSVLPIFLDQVSQGRPITVTNRKMTRFFITIPEAVDRMMKAAYYCQGGETFVLKMKSFRIGELADALCDYFGESGVRPRIQTIGLRPGEKFHEELIFDCERERVLEDGELYAVFPTEADAAGTYLHFNPASIHTYRSNQGAHITKDELKSIVAQEHQKYRVRRGGGSE